MPVTKKHQAGTPNRGGVGNYLVRNAQLASRASRQAQTTFARAASVGTSSCTASLGGPTDLGFAGSIVEANGGTTFGDPNNCPALGNASNGGTLGGLDNVNNGADCPDDGDILMWRAGSGTKKGEWVNVKLKEALARNCLEYPNDLDDEDCATEKAKYDTPDCSSLTRSILVARSATLGPFGDGSHGEFDLEEDSKLNVDGLFVNLHLNQFELDLKGHTLYVTNQLSIDGGRIVSRINGIDQPIIINAKDIQGQLNIVSSLPADLSYLTLSGSIERNARNGEAVPLEPIVQVTV